MGRGCLKTRKVYIRNPNLTPNRAPILSRGTIRSRVKSRFAVFRHPRAQRLAPPASSAYPVVLEITTLLSNCPGKSISLLKVGAT